LHTNSPSPDVATTLPRRGLFFCVAASEPPDESAEVVEDVESVLSDSASDTGSSSLARFIPTPMDDSLVLDICWIAVWNSIFLGQDGYELMAVLAEEAGGTVIYRLWRVRA
jgi:hypothetical protein